jgi:hypothetical protein
VSASGGTISTAVDNANYKLHTFTSNGTFSITTGSGYLEILLVGGGGAGGAANSSTYSYSKGGGGAGGIVTLATDIFVNGPTTFTVEVGKGGETSNLATFSTADRVCGKPSRVTATGYSYTSYGGGHGAASWGNSSAIYMNESYRNGGGQLSWNGQAENNYYSPAYARNLNPVGSPGTLSVKSASTGGSAYRTQGAGNSNGGAGGGAGYENGYSALFADDETKSSRGGDGYLWPRTNYYYGAGGGGGVTYAWPATRSYSTYSSSGRAGTYPGTLYDSGGWAYNNSGLSSGSAGLSGTEYGQGGGGGSNYVASTTNVGTGGAGAAGVVIFCYRYK